MLLMLYFKLAVMEGQSQNLPFPDALQLQALDLEMEEQADLSQLQQRLFDLSCCFEKHASPFIVIVVKCH